MLTNVSVEECKKKWKYLRGHYQKLSKAKKGKSGDGKKATKPWDFFDILSFLNPFVASNPKYVQQ
jgi:hypothetical protein